LSASAPTFDPARAARFLKARVDASTTTTNTTMGKDERAKRTTTN
jgi:hypothetical protein